MSDYGFLIFGGAEDGLQLPNLFRKWFAVEKMKECWEKVGAVPLTRKCLLDPKVRHEIFVDSDGAIDFTKDPQAAHLSQIQAENKISCDELNKRGYNGDVFRLQLAVKISATGPITAPNTLERQ
ncbi:MAG: hypothetical protein ACRDL7_04355 [Gaiellaceae bacterium]